MGLNRTHLYEYHQKFGRLVEFAGFEMPIWYKSIATEHLAVRSSAGLFDVTHMGRILIKGHDAAKFLDYVTTRDSSNLAQTQGHYNIMCNDSGGIKDDITTFRLKEDEFLAICNAINREKDYRWLMEHSKDFQVELEDISDTVPMFAIQGPKAQEIMQKLTATDLSTIKRYWLRFIDFGEIRVSLSRSGYTGEDGFELYIWDTPITKPEAAIKIWNGILAAGGESIYPCGLGARDTLRLEAGMCLYGNDIDESTTPLEAKLDFAVKFEKPKFIGREALFAQKQTGVNRVRVGLKMLDQAIPRRGFTIKNGGNKIGEVTSGTYSPLLHKGIAMAYLPPAYSADGTIVDVDVRGKTVKASVCSMPFYDIERYGWRRKHF
jgi:aminomethyltransferase